MDVALTFLEKLKPVFLFGCNFRVPIPFSFLSLMWFFWVLRQNLAGALQDLNIITNLISIYLGIQVLLADFN